MSALNAFFIYSFAGWVLETLYAMALTGRYASRKCFLMLPMCPVYGIGAMLITYVMTPYRSNIIILFLGGALLASCAEYVAHAFYEGVYRIAYWDYSTQPFNLHGRVCLLYTLMWGGLSIPLVLWVNPVVNTWISGMPLWLTVVLIIFTAIDATASLYVMRRYRPETMPGVGRLYSMLLR